MNSWRLRLRPLDPAGARLVADALRRETGLIALHPRTEAPIPDLTWVPLADPPVEELLLIVKPRR